MVSEFKREFGPTLARSGNDRPRRLLSIESETCAKRISINNFKSGKPVSVIGSSIKKTLHGLIYVIGFADRKRQSVNASSVDYHPVSFDTKPDRKLQSSAPCMQYSLVTGLSGKSAIEKGVR